MPKLKTTKGTMVAELYYALTMTVGNFVALAAEGKHPKVADSLKESHFL
jgi:cyclophilin family peptidyl-prolyl cis-trans isomerase